MFFLSLFLRKRLMKFLITIRPLLTIKNIFLHLQILPVASLMITFSPHFALNTDKNIKDYFIANIFQK